MEPGATVRLIAYLVVLATGIGIFAYNIRRRLTVLKLARSMDARGDVYARIQDVLVNVFGQYRLLHGDPAAGTVHFMLFWGFVVLLFNTLHFILHGLFPAADLHLPFLGRDEPLGTAYLLARDVVCVLVLVACAWAAYRRVVLKVKRVKPSSEALVILGLIAGLMVTEILMDASAVALGMHTAGGLSFVERGLGPLFAGFGPAANAAIYNVDWWLHLLDLLLFLNLLPLSKHFHVLTSVFKVYLRNRQPMGELGKVDVEAEMEKDEPHFGWSKLQDFSWSNWLDSYSCTECGRCDYFCPAKQTGKVLSPQKIVTNTREQIYLHTPKMLVRMAQAQAKARELVDPGRAAVTGRHENGAHGGAPGENGFPLHGPGGVTVLALDERTGDPIIDYRDIVLFDESDNLPEFVGQVHLDEALWACTTCGACDEHCPLFIEHVHPIVEMRRHLVLEQEGRYPSELTKTFTGLERQSNPWGLPAHDRLAWARDLNVKTLDQNPGAEWIYFVGCLASFDDRNKETARALIQLMQHAGLDFALLSKEGCSGDPARRTGNEYLAQMLMEHNAEQFREAGATKVRQVVTACPHCFNTLKQEYQQFGVEFGEVVHHSELLTRLVAEGKLKPKQNPALGRVVFHDSCYLGRYNKVYEQPRDVVRAVAGAELLEADYHHDKGFCCGAGGGRMFMEETVGQRVNEWRYDQLTATGADTVAVACPFCNVMLDDASKSDKEHRPQKPVKDIAIILRDAVLG
jgi:Fe-S oxidoreductase